MHSKTIVIKPIKDMNNRFELSRFKNVIVYDFHQYLHRFGIVLAILIGISTLGTWITSLSFDSFTNIIEEDINVSPFIRYMTISYMFWLAIWIAPAWIYGFINMKKDGPQYATLPASYLEKFLSILFYTLIVTPVAFEGGCYIVDTLLTLLPWGGYNEFIWNLDTNELIKMFDTVPEFDYDFPTIRRYYIYGIISMISSSAFMFFTSTIFKKHKISKTFAIVVIISFVAIIAFFASLPSVIEYIDENITLDNHIDEYFEERLMPMFMNASIIFCIVQTVVCYLWGYYRMKRMKF